MNRYLFLIGYLSESDGACGEVTNIDSAVDLYLQYLQNNDYINICVIEAPNKEVAYAYGCKWAFLEDFIAKDAVTDCIKINITHPQYKHVNIKVNTKKEK